MENQTTSKAKIFKDYSNEHGLFCYKVFDDFIDFQDCVMLDEYVNEFGDLKLQQGMLWSLVDIAESASSEADRILFLNRVKSKLRLISNMLDDIQIYVVNEDTLNLLYGQLCQLTKEIDRITDKYNYSKELEKDDFTFTKEPFAESGETVKKEASTIEQA